MARGAAHAHDGAPLRPVRTTLWIGVHRPSGLSAAIYCDNEAQARSAFRGYAGYCDPEEVELTELASGTIEQLQRIADEAGYG